METDPNQKSIQPVPDSRNGSNGNNGERIPAVSLLWKLANAYPNQKIAADTVNEYLEELVGIPTKWIEIACNKARSQDEWFPSVAALRKYAIDAKAAHEAPIRAADWIESEVPRDDTSAVPYRAFFGKDAPPKLIDKWLVLVGRISRTANLPRYRNSTWDGKSDLRRCAEDDPDPQKRSVAAALERIILDRDIDGLVALTKEVGADWIV